MKSTRRLASFALPIALLVCLAASRGAAQGTNQDSRFVFADTTLVRDTLGLTFERLFPLADSLRMTPAALKALSVQYRWSLARLVKMADSLAVPIDSVGPIIERERFNPLSNLVTRNSLTYVTNYSVQRTSDSWSNDVDYRLSRGAAYMTNTTRISLDNTGIGGTRGQRQTRSAVTEAGWKLSQRLSVGGRADLSRFDSVTPSGINGEAERVNAFDFSVRGKLPNYKGFATDLNAFGGNLNVNKRAEQKDGWSGELNGKLRYGGVPWLSHDLSFQAKSGIATASATDPDPSDAIDFPKARSRDNFSNLRGTLNVLRGHPVELNVNYQLNNSRIQTPIAFQQTRLIITPGAPPDTVRQVIASTNKQLVNTQRRGFDSALRFQRGQNRELNVGWKTGFADNASSTQLTAKNSREDRNFSSTGRYELGRVLFQGNFGINTGITRYPKRDAKGGYRETTDGHTLDGSVNWTVTPKLSAQLTGSIGLTAYRYARIDSPLTVPVAHDLYNQSYRMDVNYTRSQKLSSKVGLQVSRSQYVNLPAASTASNSETHTYRADWRWTYQLLEGLTATQQNQVNADYSYYPFAPTSNRLLLDYSTLTTLNAVLTPRFTVDVTHNARFQPSGNYRPQTPTDPTEYFSRADENRNYSLSSRMAYTPIKEISVELRPEYLASLRNTTLNEALVPQRSSKTLKLSGGASLNLNVGSRGRLNGRLDRTFNTDRTINFVSSGTGSGSAPRTETSFWNGLLTFTWSL